MERGYQYNYSDKQEGLYDSHRENKAKTLVKVLEDFLGKKLEGLSLLNVGGSTGVIDAYLARQGMLVIGVDIDVRAISYA